MRPLSHTPGAVDDNLPTMPPKKRAAQSSDNVGASVASSSTVVPPALKDFVKKAARATPGHWAATGHSLLHTSNLTPVLKDVALKRWTGTIDHAGAVAPVPAAVGPVLVAAAAREREAEKNVAGPAEQVLSEELSRLEGMGGGAAIAGRQARIKHLQGLVRKMKGSLDMRVGVFGERFREEELEGILGAEAGEFVGQLEYTAARPSARRIGAGEDAQSNTKSSSLDGSDLPENEQIHHALVAAGVLNETWRAVQEVPAPYPGLSLDECQRLAARINQMARSYYVSSLTKKLFKGMGQSPAEKNNSVDLLIEQVE